MGCGERGTGGCPPPALNGQVLMFTDPIAREKTEAGVHGIWAENHCYYL